jgi:hypothetical protein
MDVPAVISTHDGHALQGSPSSPRAVQLRALARSRADVVLPVPRGPEKR